MKTKSINKADVSSIIATIPANHIFQVTFVKKNGEVRSISCRTGVTSYLTPNPKRVKAELPKNMITVFDMANKGYRTINMDSTLKISAEKRVFIVK